MYDNQARTRDPLFDRFTSIDPMAEKYPDFSPYVVCKNNPLMRIDPDGRDDFNVDQCGNLTSAGRTKGVSFSMANDQPQRISILGANIETQTISYKYDNDKGTEETVTTEATFITIDDPGEAKQLFEFLADHTDVKISLTSMTQKVPKGKSKNVVSTSHAESSDITMSTMVEANKNSFYINDLYHSHPAGHNPSEEDSRYKLKVIEMLNQEVMPQHAIYKPNKINRHSAIVNNRF